MCNAQKFGIAGMAIGVVSLLHSIYIQTRINKASTVIDKSINEISKDIDINVPEAIIDKAVNKAVDREIHVAIKSASIEAIEKVRQDIQKEVKTSVNDAYTDIRKSVSDEVSKQVANIDMARLKNEVREKAKELIVSKFDENLDSLLQDFNQSLSNVRKIYDSIADSVTKKSSETVFRIGG